MKVSKNIIVIMLFFCILFLAATLFFEFKTLKITHSDFYQNIGLSLFASGVLVLVPTITQYVTEKRRYYIEMQRILNSLLHYIMEIVECIVANSQDGTINIFFDSLGLVYKELIAQYSQFTRFFMLSNKDKLIETIITDSVKFIMINKEIIKYSKQLQKKEISEADYYNCFQIVRNEIINDFKNNFNKYQELIDIYMTTNINDKKLKKYF